MSDFVLIDIYDQREAVTAYIQGWTAEGILNWMSKYGTVRKLTHSGDDNLYGFVSASGSQAAFRFTEDQGLVILQPR